jgi:hypothetical protein
MAAEIFNLDIDVVINGKAVHLRLDENKLVVIDEHRVLTSSRDFVALRNVVARSTEQLNLQLARVGLDAKP